MTFPEALSKMLRVEHDKGNIRVEKKIKAEDICRRWHAKTGEKITDVDVREAVHERRRVGDLIISGTDGYCWADSVQQFISQCEHLKSRALKEFEAYYNPIKRHEKKQTEDLFKDDPVFRLALDTFKLKEVKE